MLANYHTHTTRCKHAVGTDREYVEHAIMGGIKVLGFSDHCPWNFNNGYVSNIRMLPNQLDEYFTSLTDLKNEYASDIKIYIGFESEYIKESIEEQNKLLKDYPVDYMILGQHFFEPEPDAVYTGAATNDEKILEKYINSIIAGMETGKYKYIAHPDLLNYTGSDSVYNEHLTRLCTYLKEKNIPVEINLLGLRDGRNYPCDRFLKIAQSVGNTAIIGYDAHFPEALSSQKEMDDCRRLAEKYNLELIDYLPGLGK